MNEPTILGDQPGTPSPVPHRVPGAAHHRLGVFIGSWHTEGEIQTDSPGVTLRLHATDSYEWMPGGYFLVHRVDGRMGDMVVQALEVIGYDEDCDCYVSQSFDNSGNTASYRAYLRGDEWSIEGARERFTGVFSEDRRTLRGRWERSADGEEWRPWMAITLTRMP